ncbi:hypothetical protein AAHH21_13520 [Stenotrophomonas sp. BSUC-16]|uniref:hypothetical protein n=1 Tax=Stenotrophomonas sp. BSUC-16 TaxID=3156074 RepID=UPI003395E17B
MPGWRCGSSDIAIPSMQAMFRNCPSQWERSCASIRAIAFVGQRGGALPLLVGERDIAVRAFVRITQATVYRQQANQDIVTECFKLLLRQHRRIELPRRVVLEGHEGVILPLPRRIGLTQIIQHHAQAAVR